MFSRSLFPNFLVFFWSFDYYFSQILDNNEFKLKIRCYSFVILNEYFRILKVWFRISWFPADHDNTFNDICWNLNLRSETIVFQIVNIYEYFRVFEFSYSKSRDFTIDPDFSFFCNTCKYITNLINQYDVFQMFTFFNNSGQPSG